MSDTELATAYLPLAELSDSIFLVGILDKGVTIRSQQIRALNLVWALDHSGRSKPVHPALHRRRGERDRLPDLGERGPGVGRERRNDCLVCGVKVQRIASRPQRTRLFRTSHAT